MGQQLPGATFHRDEGEGHGAGAGWAPWPCSGLAPFPLDHFCGISSLHKATARLALLLRDAQAAAAHEQEQKTSMISSAAPRSHQGHDSVRKKNRLRRSLP